ncbi:MAG: hypothetical protein ABIW34_11970, partial [Ginsengibacter sp.]
MQNIQKLISVIIFTILFSRVCKAQVSWQFMIYDDVKITMDVPANYSASKRTIIVLYPLPNGNTTEQTMGKKMKEDDDWHFDIQHIKAQTKFVRNELKKQNIVIAYLENNYKSWPSWKTKHANYIAEVQHITDTIFGLFTS